MNKNILWGGMVSALFIAGAIFAFNSGSQKVAAEDANPSVKPASCACQGGPAKCGANCACGCQNKAAQTGASTGCGCGK
ncbi:MAG TPA: hypothetical protein PKI61_00370 [bacterium]|nr:hypothetical protein [bacterium]HPT29497.1 hypothetical protein [bacterium]